MQKLAYWSTFLSLTVAANWGKIYAKAPPPSLLRPSSRILTRNLIMQTYRYKFALRSATCAMWMSLMLAAASGQINVTTYQNDNSRTGQNLNETILTTANVSTSTF